jgi:hypothetical protein
MPYPDGIGARDAQILFAGPADFHKACKPTLDCLGGDLRHVSEDVGAAAVLDMALLTHQLSNYLGVWHGARACEAEGLGIEVFASMLAPEGPAAHLAWRIHRVDYDNPGATLEVWNAALDRIVEHAQRENQQGNAGADFKLLSPRHCLGPWRPRHRHGHGGLAGELGFARTEQVAVLSLRGPPRVNLVSLAMSAVRRLAGSMQTYSQRMRMLPCERRSCVDNRPSSKLVMSSQTGHNRTLAAVMDVAVA